MQPEETQNIEYDAPEFPELERQAAQIEPVPTPDDPPWSGFVAFGIWVFSVFCIIVFPILFVFPYVARQNIDRSDPARLTEFITSDPTSIILQLLSVFPAHILTLIAAWLVVTRFRTYSFRQTLGWRWGGFRLWHIVAILVFFFALAAALTGIFGEQENDFLKILRSSRAAVYLVAAFAVFTAPVVEEVVYRGLLYSAFKRRIGVAGSVALVTFLFALVHVPQYSKEWVPDVASILLIVVLSLVLTLVRVKTGNLLPCIVLHTIFNGVQAILLILQPWLEKYATPPDPTVFILPFLK